MFISLGRLSPMTKLIVILALIGIASACTTMKQKCSEDLSVPMSQCLNQTPKSRSLEYPVRIVCPKNHMKETVILHKPQSAKEARAMLEDIQEFCK